MKGKSGCLMSGGHSRTAFPSNLVLCPSVTSAAEGGSRSPGASSNFRVDVLSFRRRTLPQAGLTRGASSRIPFSSASPVAESVSAKGARRAGGLPDEP